MYVIQQSDDRRPIYKLSKCSEPLAKQGEVLIAVQFAGVNSGNLALGAVGHVPGWDFSGRVIDSQSKRFKIGDRVMGLVTQGAWAQQLIVDERFIVKIPESLASQHVANLPVPGLTAFYSIQKTGSLLNKRLLVTGSTGTVGNLVHQLAELTGSEHYGVVREVTSYKLKDDDPIRYVQIDKLDSLKQDFDWIIDSLGGPYISPLLRLLKSDGTLLSVGNAASNVVSFNYANFLEDGRGGQRLERFFLGHAIKQGSFTSDLSYLGQLVVKGRLVLKEPQLIPLSEVVDYLTQRINHPSKVARHAVIQMEE